MWVCVNNTCTLQQGPQGRVPLLHGGDEFWGSRGIWSGAVGAAAPRSSGTYHTLPVFPKQLLLIPKQIPRCFFQKLILEAFERQGLPSSCDQKQWEFPELKHAQTKPGWIYTFISCCCFPLIEKPKPCYLFSCS